MWHPQVKQNATRLKTDVSRSYWSNSLALPAEALWSLPFWVLALSKHNNVKIFEISQCNVLLCLKDVTSAGVKKRLFATFSFIHYVMELSFPSVALKRKEIPFGIHSQWGVHMEHFHLVWTYEQFLTGMCVFVSCNPVAYLAKLSFIHVFFTTILARQSGKQTHLFF